ncbi:MAG: Rare lipoprotein A precursor, partial [uncultured Solirubrobacteraceae bacterium]
EVEQHARPRASCPGRDHRIHARGRSRGSSAGRSGGTRTRTRRVVRRRGRTGEGQEQPDRRHEAPERPRRPHRRRGGAPAPGPRRSHRDARASCRPRLEDDRQGAYDGFGPLRAALPDEGRRPAHRPREVRGRQDRPSGSPAGRAPERVPARAGVVVRPRPVRQRARLRRSPVAWHDRRRAQVAAVRHEADAAQGVADRPRPRDRPRPVRRRPRVRPHPGHEVQARVRLHRHRVGRPL